MSSVAQYFWLQLGRWLSAKDMASAAEVCYRHASAGRGRLAAEAAFLLGKRLLARDKNSDAVPALMLAVGNHPAHARAWCALGAAYRRVAQLDNARQAFEEALRLDAGYAQARSNLGEWHLAKGDAAAALVNIEQALEGEPYLVEALNNKAAALYELGRFEEAETAARLAIELHPDVAALHVNLGNVLLHTGKARQAVTSFRKALECDAAYPEALLNLSMILGETGHLGEAQAFIEHEIAVKGESAQRLAALALAQHAGGNYVAAEETCGRALGFQPGNVSALITLAGCRSVRGDHRGAIAAHEQALSSNPVMPAIYSNIAFDATYLPDLSAQQVFDYHVAWAKRFESPLREKSYRHVPTAPADRVLRIGYISGDFTYHPVGFLLRDVMCQHDKERFELHCFSMVRKEDDITATLREKASAWHDVLFSSDEEVAAAVRDAGIDILVDLSGHTAYNRLGSLALKPAPVQATWIGYFHSTGLESVDYFITDPYTSPRASGQLFSETPVWLPHSRFCYSPPDYAGDVSPPPVLKNGYVTFGSFNRVEKHVDEVVACWAKVLQRVPDSRLLLKAGSLGNEAMRGQMLDRFTTYGIASERVELRGRSSHALMFEEYGDLDIALDTFPFNGGMTTLEALWMGVPVVTIAGNTVVSRQTFSVLANIGLAEELAFADIDAYIEGAAALAKDSEKLARLRSEIRPRMMASPICQPEQFARDLESLYRRMWQSWCKGERLDGLDR